MVEKFCKYIIEKMKNKMPDMGEEQEEIILYGLELIIGEIPKLFILFGLGFLLGVGWYVLFAFIAIAPYREVSGGFHLHSHIGCIIMTNLFYIGTALISKYIILDTLEKYILIGFSLIFGIIMISIYAPADTENVPIISKKERKKKKVLAYIFLIIMLTVAIFIPNRILSNILIIGSIIQTLFITRIAYKLTRNEYGHEMYEKGKLELNG